MNNLDRVDVLHAKMLHAIALLEEAKKTLLELLEYVERVEEQVFNSYRGA